MKRLFGFVFSLFVAAVAFAAPPAATSMGGGYQASGSSIEIVWTWTDSGCTGCTYTMYQGTTTQASNCQTGTGVTYTQLVAGLTATTYTQQSPPLGQITCTYVTATAGGLTSSPSSSFPLSLVAPQSPSGLAGTVEPAN